MHAGQDVVIKVETFDFTKYGFVHGTVNKVSRDAIADRDRGLVYSARIALAEDSIAVNKTQVKLAAGMIVSAEFKSSERRVIEFLLSPLIRYQNESGRER